MNKNEPAFPVANLKDPNQADGMTLRDYFAGQAMKGLVASAFKHLATERAEKGPVTDGAIAIMKEVGATAYLIANAMLAEREKETK